MIRHLGPLIDCFVRNVKNDNNDPTRDYFDQYYIPLVGIKDFKALIDNKPFFDQPVKNKQEAYEKIIEIPKNDNYATKNLLDYSDHQECYKLIGIDLSRQTIICIPQKINFVGKLEDNGATMFFVSEKQQNTSKLFFRFINCNRVI